MGADPRVPAAFRSASPADPHAPLGDAAPAAAATPDPPAPPDPLRLCVATTVALIAWAITPPLAVALFAGAALIAYARARRAGLLASRCKLGDTRLVMAYLALACAGGVAATAWRLLG